MKLTRGRSLEVTRLEDVLTRVQPVDLQAFRNLVDPAEELFLRENLSASEFRSIQRERMRAAVEYVKGAAENASLLLQFGQLAVQSADPRIAQAGQQLVDNAARLRLYALLARTKLYVRIAIPQVNLSPGRLLDGYERLSSLAGNLVAVQEPSRAAQIAAVL